MILTTEEFRSLGSTELEDDALALLLDAIESDIIRFAGPSGERVETFGGGSDLRYLVLRGTAESITSIVESAFGNDTTLDVTDYVLWPDGYTLERLRTGSHTRWRWWGRITVRYVSVDDEALRKSVQFDLTNLALTYQPGVTMTTVGSWTEQLAGNSVWNRDVERQTILARLSPGPTMAVVGG